MPPADDAFTILVCGCGKRLRAPGATPGRVGRCPACGGTLRAPAGASGDAVGGAANLGEPGGGNARRKAAGGTTKGAAAPADEADPSEDVLPARVGTRIERPKSPAGPVGREGLVRAPERPEPTLRANLLYPLWDGNGLAVLAFLPPVLGLTSLFSIGLVPSYVIDADVVTKMGAMTMIFPMGVLLALASGYVCTFLCGVITSSALGDVLHPRVPPWQLGPTLVSLFRCLWALAAGMIVSGPLLIGYRLTRETLGPGDWPIAAAIAAPGAAYAGVALVAVLLHESLAAANPFTVFRALAKSGADSARLALILAGSAAATLGVAALLFRLPAVGAWAVIAGVWAFWVAVLYLAMVASRVLGLFYRRHAEAIGWFPERGRWGGWRGREN